MRKTFHIYVGLATQDIMIFAGGILAVYANLEYAKINGSASIYLFLSISLFLLGLYLVVKHFSYKITIQDGILKESGWKSGNREININSVKTIIKGNYNLFFRKIEDNSNIIPRVIGLILSAGTINTLIEMPMLLFVGDFPEKSDFPKHPINPKIVDELIQINPNIKINHSVIDLISNKVKKDKKMKMSAADRLGLWLWRFLGFLLFILILFFAVMLVLSYFIRK
jgi:hypothetical protein